MKVLFNDGLIDVSQLPEGEYMTRDSSVHRHYTPPYVIKSKLLERLTQENAIQPKVTGGDRFCKRHSECFIESSKA